MFCIYEVVSVSFNTYINIYSKILSVLVSFILLLLKVGEITFLGNSEMYKTAFLPIEFMPVGCIWSCDADTLTAI